MKCSLCKADGHNKRACTATSAATSAATPIPEMDAAARVLRLKEHLALATINHEKQLMKLPTLKDAHVYCVIHSIAAQQYGPLLERYIQAKFAYVKNKAKDCLGDCAKDGKNCEIKVSLGGATHSRFNFVQIRPSHDCDAYLLTAYHLSPENAESEGELFVFRVPKADMISLVVAFGGYAHGTVKEHGPVTIETDTENGLNRLTSIKP